jgi:hypothetical protein
MRCGAKTRNGDPCKNPPMRGARRCRMHGAAAPEARRASARRLLEARMSGFVARMLAQRQPELDELREHGLTPFTWGLERALGSSPDRNLPTSGGG